MNIEKCETPILNYNNKLSDVLIKCKRCGKCCTGTLGYTVLLKEDIEEIEKVAGNFIYDILYDVEINGKKFKAMKQPCVFYDESIGCTIYNARPLCCRQFPVTYFGGHVLFDASFCPAAKETLEETKREYLKIMKENFSEKGFIFDNNFYLYFNHGYNETMSNERCIEIPIITEYVKKYAFGNVLEIGNVTSHYFPTSHDIIDLEEQSNTVNIINQDIADYKPDKKYDLIFSISTLEHVGFTLMEEPGQYKPTSGYIEKAFKNIISLLNTGGTLVFTVPLGYNPELDNFILFGNHNIDKLYCIERDFFNNKWKEIDFSELYHRDHLNKVTNEFDTNGVVHSCRKTTYVIIGIKTKGEIDGK